MSSSWRMYISWMVLAAGGLWGISVARAAGPSTSVLATGLAYGYLTWSLYWGGPSFFAWWRNTFFKLSGPMAAFASFGCGFQVALAFLALFFVGIPFCTLGGGIFHFTRCWRAARYHI